MYYIYYTLYILYICEKLSHFFTIGLSLCFMVLYGYVILSTCSFRDSIPLLFKVFSERD